MNQEELLAAIRPMIDWQVSRAAFADHQRRQEWAQEGWIAAWKYFQKEPDKPLSWYQQHARMRIRQLMYDKERPARFTGQPERSPGAAAKHIPVKELELPGVVHEQLEWAYHHGEIQEAINTLTPRQQEYVYLRFFKGWNTTELAKHFTPGTASYAWKLASEQLRQKLAHLKG